MSTITEIFNTESDARVFIDNIRALYELNHILTLYDFKEQAYFGSGKKSDRKEGWEKLELSSISLERFYYKELEKDVWGVTLPYPEILGGTRK